eukprot:CAMPEP_0185027674 /NCGR_PEP_ID=MMETSP1103-20130426/12912_1 /TAXON_ID=36769 /ORGANISM="Paraphysomonas bandaiensis, Strain Caron Lab Isolate" /LENGTH=388 /DNA_ID=CAMNT_0027561779 /DNA_START=194 /DNA_END=1360 /DNA_ORIENTATION=+
MPLTQRVLGPLLITAAVFVMTTILVTIDVNKNLLFIITLLSCMVVGLSNALLSGGLFGLCGSFPPQYTGALMGGQGLAGLAVSVASIVTTWAGNPVDICTDDDVDDDDGSCEEGTDYSALAYFCVTCVVMGTCVFSFLALMSLPFTKYFQEKSLADHARGPSVDDDVTKALIQRLTNNSMDEETENLVDTKGTAPPVDVQPAAISPAKVMKVFKQVKPAALGAYMSYLVTLSLFPSITVLIESQKQCDSNASRFNNDLFIPFFFLMFNLFDFFGRVFAGIHHLGITKENVLLPICLRVVFVPLFLLCNVSGSQLPVVFKSDAWPILFMIVFAFTNGHFSTMAMMFGPSMVSARNSGLAGTIMIFFLTFGLLSGAAMSFVLLYISQGSI